MTNVHKLQQISKPSCKVGKKKEGSDFVKNVSSIREMPMVVNSMKHPMSPSPLVTKDLPHCSLMDLTVALKPRLVLISQLSQKSTKQSLKSTW